MRRGKALRGARCLSALALTAALSCERSGTLEPDAAAVGPDAAAVAPDAAVVDREDAALDARLDARAPATADGTVRLVNVCGPGAVASFDAVAEMEWHFEGGFGPTLPSPLRFWLRVELTERDARVRIGGGGMVGTASLVRAGETWTGDARTLTLPVRVAAPNPCGPANPPGLSQARLETLDLVLTDADCDGAPEALEGRATGWAGYFVDDAGDLVTFTAHLTGARDSTAPTALAQGGHVLDGLYVTTSEPVAATEAWVQGAIDLQLEPRSVDMLTTAFVTNRVLPWGELRVRFEPPLADLDGNEGASHTGVVRTLDDPGLLEQDGFESVVAGWYAGRVTVAGITDGPVAPITGARSLLVVTGGYASPSRFTARLAVPPGATRVRARYRNAGSSGVVVWVVALGDGARTGAPLSCPAGSPPGAGDAGWGRLCDVAELDVALPEGAGDEVLFDLDARTPPEACAGGAPPPDSAIQLDDLRVE